MAIFTTEAIVLKQFNLGEADQIITFYTKEKGKVRAVASNVRKTKNRMSGLLQPFSYNNMKFYRGNSLDRINQISNRYSFSELREELSLMAYATYIAEIVEKVGMEDDAQPDLFSLLLSTFHKMTEIPTDELDYLNLCFKLRMLAVIGFKPEINSCVFCESSLETAVSNNFNISRGGISCRDCYSKDDGHEYFQLTGEEIKVIAKIYNSGLKLPENLRISRKGLQDLETFVDKFMKYHLDIFLKSEDFLYMIRDLG